MSKEQYRFVLAVAKKPGYCQICRGEYKAGEEIFFDNEVRIGGRGTRVCTPCVDDEEEIAGTNLSQKKTGAPAETSTPGTKSPGGNEAIIALQQQQNVLLQELITQQKETNRAVKELTDGLSAIYRLLEQGQQTNFAPPKKKPSSEFDKLIKLIEETDQIAAAFVKKHGQLVEWDEGNVVVLSFPESMLKVVESTHYNKVKRVLPMFEQLEFVGR